MSRETKRLWKIRVDHHLLVLASDRSEAKRLALTQYAQDELLSNPSRNMKIVCEVTHTGSVPPGWMERIPYGKNLSRLLEGKTVREILTRGLFRPFNRKKNGNRED